MKNDEDANEWVRKDALAGLVGLPFVLILIHFVLPESLQQALAFYHSNFFSYGIFTGAFVHNSDLHLYGNLIGYVLTVSYVYGLSVYSGAIRWFRRTFLAIVVLLPILTNITSYAILAWQYPSATPVSRGFSGVVAGFGGMLLVALYRTLWVEFNRDVAWATSLSLFLLLMQLISFQYRGGPSLRVTGLVGAGILLLVAQYVYEHPISIESLDDFRRMSSAFVFIVLVAAVLALLIIALFPQPSSLVENGTFTNVFGHAAGFFWGIIVSAGILVNQSRVS